MKLLAFAKWIYDKPVDEMADILATAGFDGVDLPVREKVGIPAEAAKKVLPEAKKIFADRGLLLEQLVTDIIAPRPGLDELLELFRNVGITKIRLGGKPLPLAQDVRMLLDEHRRDLEALEPYLERHEIRGAIQIHTGNTAHATMGLCLHCVEGRNPQWMGIQVDTGHLMVAGEAPELALALAGPYLHSINLKAIRRDVVIDPKTEKVTWPRYVVPLRDGMVDWKSVLAAVQKTGYSEPMTIHAEYRSPYYGYEKDTEFTTGLIGRDRAYIARLLQEMGM